MPACLLAHSLSRERFKRCSSSLCSSPSGVESESTPVDKRRRLLRFDSFAGTLAARRASGRQISARKPSCGGTIRRRRRRRHHVDSGPAGLIFFSVFPSVRSLRLSPTVLLLNGGGERSHSLPFSICLVPKERAGRNKQASKQASKQAGERVTLASISKVELIDVFFASLATVRQGTFGPSSGL